LETSAIEQCRRVYICGQSLLNLSDLLYWGFYFIRHFSQWSSVYYSTKLFIGRMLMASSCHTGTGNMFAAEHAMMCIFSKWESLPL